MQNEGLNNEEEPKELTPKQKIFIERYCVHFNATKAAYEAGYSDESCRQIGSENLSKPYISDAIKHKLTELSMSSEEAIKRLTDMGRGSIESFLDLDKDGRILIDFSSDKAKENLGLIKRIKQTRKQIGDTEIIEVVSEVELHDAKDAIVKILTMQGKFNLKQQVENTIKLGKELNDIYE